MSTWNSALWNSTLWNGAPGGSGVRPVTAGRLIHDAYRALGVLRPGQRTSPDGYEDAHGLLNDIVDSWNTEALMIPSLRRSVYPLMAGVGSYTIGPGGTLSGERPQRVVSAGLVSCGCGCGCADRGCNRLVLAGNWYDDCGASGIRVDHAFPDAGVEINPPPTVGQSLALQYWQTLTAFSDLETPQAFPPGYALALRWALAQQLAPMALIMMKIPQSLLQSIEQRAIESKAAVKSFNSYPPPVMAVDAGLSCCGGNYNILTDGY
jgi:hypothetical protein